MAAPVKDGKVWRHRVMIAGKRVSGTFDTKAAALHWEAEQRTISKGGGAATHQTVEDAFERYEREVSRQKKGYRWEALRLAAFSRSALAQVRIKDVNASHIAAWRDERLKDVQGSTVQRELNLMSNVFTVARREWKWIDHSPTTDVRRPKENPPRFRRVTEDEIAMICHTLGWQNKTPETQSQQVARAFLFAIETAMRAGEICSLTRASVTGRVAHLEKTKNGMARDVPMSARALELWNLDPNGFSLTSDQLDALFRKYRDKTTIVDLHFHDSRHEAITRLAKKLHVLDLARMVGHKDIKKLMIYYNESAEDIADKL